MKYERYCNIPRYPCPNMEQPATAPITSNAIRGADQRSNIAKQRFARKGEKVRGYHGNLGGLINKW